MRQTVVRFVVLVVLAVVLVVAWLGSFGPGTGQDPSDASWTRKYSVDASARSYVDTGLKNALLTYATARGLGAILSVAQGTDVSLEPGGIGVKLSPGQVLHPLNQLVGQFADIMLVASIAFLAMEVLLRIGSSWPVSLALSLVAIAWVGYYLRRGQAPKWLARILFVVILLRFAVPLVSLASEGIYNAFMAKEYIAAQAAMTKASSDRLGVVPAVEAPKSDKGWLEGMRDRLWPTSPVKAETGTVSSQGWIDTLRDWTSKLSDPGERAKQLMEATEKAAEHIMKLMMIFLLQTIVIPLLLGWVLLKIAAALLQIRSQT